MYERNEVIKDFFYITYCENTGAAWGILQNGRIFFIIMTFIALGFIVFYFFKDKAFIFRLALVFLMSGAVGNLIDRILYGKVVDFLDFYIFKYDFPVFNVADICVNIGTILLIIYLLFIYKEPIKETENTEKEQVENTNEIEGFS